MGWGIRSALPIFKPSESGGNLDVTIVFVKSAYLLEPKIRKMVVKGLPESKNSTFHCGP